MARCTAPRNGNRTASGAAACPACSSRRNYGSYRSIGIPPKKRTLSLRMLI